jgi:hypothetical protein
MSFGFEKCQECIEEAVKKAREKDVVMFAAASNAGRNSRVSPCPAHATGVISVFATDSFGEIQGFNPPVRRNQISFSTLGHNVNSAWPGRFVEDQNPQSCKSGTSIATPILAASVALALQFVRQKPPLEIGYLKELKARGLGGI